MPGPARKPTNLKVLQGNPSKRPLPKNEPRPRAALPTRPAWLLPEAKREWARIVPELQALGLLTIVDRAALCNYCQWWARWVQAERILSKQGLTFETGTGYIQQRPEVAIAQKAAALCKGFLTEFGLTPSSRSKISIPAPEEKDPFAEYLSKASNE